MRYFLITILVVGSAVTARAQGQAAVAKLLKQLQSTDVDTRHQAMFELQTSLDPRIPDACLPVLTQEGDSIRRLAARAIGSRWHQIPQERVPVFIAALKPHLKSDHAGLENMARRGLALLKRDFDDPMLSRSRSKRWVLYERRGLPCLIDTATMTEELLGYGTEAKMMCAYSNEELAPTVKWHPKKDMVAMEVIQHRKLSLIWVWVHGKGLTPLTQAGLCQAIGRKEDEISGPAGFFTDIVDWKGDELEFTLAYTIAKGDEMIDHEARLRWSAVTGQTSVFSDKTVK